MSAIAVSEAGQPAQDGRPSAPVSRMKRILLYTALTLLAVAMAMPFVAMLLMAFRPDDVTALRDIFFSTSFPKMSFSRICSV